MHNTGTVQNQWDDVLILIGNTDSSLLT